MEKGNPGSEVHLQRQSLKEFDVLASVDMLRHDLAQNRQITAETLGQVYDEELTYVAEGINAPLKTRFIMQNTPEGLADKTGRLMQGSLRRGVQASEEAAFGDSRLWFNAERAVHDYQEGLLIEEMMRGERPENSLVSFSPFPEEALALYGSDLVESKGYRPDRLMGFIRVYNKLDDNQLEVISISVDNSDKEAFTYVANQLGINVPAETTSNNMLGYRFMGQLDAGEQAALPDKVLSTYDFAMSKIYPEAGEFSAGRPKANEVEAWSFIEAQKDLVQWYFVQLEDLARAGNYDRMTLEERKKGLTYGFWAALKDRLRAVPDTKTFSVADFNGSYEQMERIQQEVSRSFALASARREKLVGCGMSISMSEDPDLAHLSPAEAMSEIMDDKEGVWLWKKGVCQVPKCPSPRPTEVGPCSVCRGCQRKSDKGIDLMAAFDSDNGGGKAEQTVGLEQLFTAAAAATAEADMGQRIDEMFDEVEITAIKNQEHVEAHHAEEPELVGAGA